MGDSTVLEQMESMIMEAFTDVPCGECLPQETLLHSKLQNHYSSSKEIKNAFFDLLKKGWIERASINNWRLTREGYKSIHSS